MNRGFYLQTSRIEESHWWFLHRRQLVRLLLDPLLGRDPAPRRALDLGCGTGGNLELLGEYCSDVTGLDRSAYALELARAKHPQAVLVRGDVNELADLFEADSLDLVAVFNVLYHRWIRSDAAVLAAIRGLLRPGGLLLLTEPAFPSLFRRHDDLDHGARRYRLAELERKVAGAGLTVRRASHFNLPAFVPAWLLARLQRRSATPVDEAETAGELSVPPAWINRGVYRALAAERYWVARPGRLAFGVGVLILAQRTQRKYAEIPDQIRS